MDIQDTLLFDEINLIYIVGEPILYADTILQDASKEFINEVLFYFKWGAIACAMILTAYFVIFNVILLKFEIVDPIV